MMLFGTTYRPSELNYLFLVTLRTTFSFRIIFFIIEDMDTFLQRNSYQKQVVYLTWPYLEYSNDTSSRRNTQYTWYTHVEPYKQRAHVVLCPGALTPCILFILKGRLNVTVTEKTKVEKRLEEIVKELESDNRIQVGIKHSSYKK